MFRNRYSAEGIRGFTTGKFNGKQREEMNRSAFKAIGLDIKQMYFSASDACAVAIAEGDPDKIPLAEAWAMSTGAFLSVKADVLTPLGELWASRIKMRSMAFGSARKGGEMDHPAFMAAMQAYEGHQPGDSEAGRMVGLMIHVATERATEWFWQNM